MHIARVMEVECSPSRLWRFLTEKSNLPKWLPNIVEDVPITEGPIGVGSVSRVKIREGKNIELYESQITHYVENEHLAITLTGGSMRGNPAIVRYRVYPIGAARARLEYSATIGLDGFPLVVKPIIWLVSRANAKKAMFRLQSLVREETKTHD